MQIELGQEDPLEKEMAIHSSAIAWKIPWTEEPDRLQSMGSQSQTRLSDFTCLLQGRGTRDQIANIHWNTEKARDFQKNIYFSSINYGKAFDCLDHNMLENS